MTRRSRIALFNSSKRRAPPPEAPQGVRSTWSQSGSLRPKRPESLVRVARLSGESPPGRLFSAVRTLACSSGESAARSSTKRSVREMPPPRPCEA